MGELCFGPPTVLTPNLGATNEVYEGVTDYVKNFHVDERDMTKYVIGKPSARSGYAADTGEQRRSMTALAGLAPGKRYREKETRSFPQQKRTFRGWLPIWKRS